MQIIRAKSDNVAVYFFGDDELVTLTADGLLSPLLATDINSGTHEVVQCQAPDVIAAGVLAYAEGAWVVHNAESYNLAVERAAAVDLAKRIVAIEAQFEREVAAITAGYSETEIKSWDHQVSQAERYTADPQATTLLLDAMVAASGMPKAQLVARILLKSAAYQAAYGAALGRKQAAVAALLAV